MHDQHVQKRVADLGRELLQRPRTNIGVLLYRWRYEILLGIAIPVGLLALGAAIGVAGLILTVACAVVCLTGWAPARRFVVARWWCVVTQHRLRTAFVRASIRTQNGRLPAILWTIPRDTGTFVLLSCPAGVDVHTINSERHLLATACFATDVIVRQHDRYTNVVGVLVVNRRPEHGGLIGPPAFQ